MAEHLQEFYIKEISHPLFNRGIIDIDLGIANRIWHFKRKHHCTLRNSIYKNYRMSTAISNKIDPKIKNLRQEEEAKSAEE
ncbi:hypothetical protein BZL35_00945 [Candidatus Pandoraea novymonadis]|uniref:Uncharacterized protein n=1 Tax=Candidatus Pandoraea novymonadis TaxID=1808959 RepID=A0ABX5FCI2_9BURK|nr:hypothetical protein BZL35_00945 [Candidatus Pandoraea novymonadis]